MNFPFMGSNATKDVCRYSIRYGDNSFSRGLVAHENFKLESADDRGRWLVVGPLGFGCGYYNDFKVKGGSGGILGLSNSRMGMSFPEQLAIPMGSQFGYCLTALNEPHSRGFILFGQAATPPELYPSIPFPYPNSIFYYVDLVDMSVNGKRLLVPPGTFDRNDQDEGGVIVDSGAPYSVLDPVAYDLLIAELRQVFDQLGTPYYPPKPGGNGPCWGAKNFDPRTFPFPRILWHFRDGNVLEISIKGSYVLYKTASHLMSLCLPFVRDIRSGRVISVIGGHSQINTYMYFDQPNQRLGWINNAC
ncbi:hypothetical protein Mapa_012382 [Marchantia paleacea]|nr:hypothetical protein Mapa_012382 [Marchantia paleacea]